MPTSATVRTHRAPPLLRAATLGAEPVVLAVGVVPALRFALPAGAR